ncbi:nitrate/nitrite transporter NrtS [Salinivibrio sp. IB872]|uniref:nitrate/nitrite transporter NrtS n=1 Tax=Salinivibrio sp. IB872 TaxID=1766123 RepID=UPI000985AA45|nr:nitrate/nitrite transporter NrtS [Salinivibrio sp. IB872]OOF28307.1 hypothetical protein BZJ18_05490 [Salinivibrio sp. IB872]
MRSLIRILVERSLVINAIKIALVVGTILNIINQGDALWADGSFSIGHALLNYLVPYSVASYSAAKYQLNQSTSPSDNTDNAP